MDWRNSLEDELDVHNSHQSFASRKRMLNADGDASNQVIWFTDVVVSNQRFDQTPEALEVMDEWMANIRANPWNGVAANKPPRATDRCFTETGAEIARGPDVWNGIIDSNPAGACTLRFKTYSTSRRVAGGPFEQSLFKCQLIPVSQAIARGFYGVWTPAPAQAGALAALYVGDPAETSTTPRPSVRSPPSGASSVT